MIDAICLRKNCLVRPRLEVRADPCRLGCAEVVVTHTVMDRDMLAQVDVSMSVGFYLPEQPMTIVGRIRDVFMALLQHEIDEAMHYEGVRVFDPHTVSVS